MMILLVKEFRHSYCFKCPHLFLCKLLSAVYHLRVLCCPHQLHFSSQDNNVVFLRDSCQSTPINPSQWWLQVSGYSPRWEGIEIKGLNRYESNFNVNERRRRKIFFLCWEKILNSTDFLTQILGKRGVFSIYVAFTSLKRWFWIFTEFHLTWQAQSRINSKFLSLSKKSFKTTTLSTEARLRMWSSSHQFIPMRWHSNNIPTLILSVYEYSHWI